MNDTPTQREEFEEWLETVKYDNSDILSPSGLAWEAWQAAQKELTEQRDKLAVALQSIKCELGVPQPEYPSPVANAYWIADEALQSLNQDHFPDVGNMIGITTTEP